MLKFILVITIFYNGVAVTTVPGFTSRDSCEEAAREAGNRGEKSQGFGQVPYVRAFCVAGPVQK